MNTETYTPDSKSCDEEWEEVERMMDECERKIQELKEEIEGTIEMINNLLRVDDELAAEDYTGELSADQLYVLMHGTQKLKP